MARVTWLGCTIRPSTLITIDPACIFCMEPVPGFESSRQSNALRRRSNEAGKDEGKDEWKMGPEWREDARRMTLDSPARHAVYSSEPAERYLAPPWPLNGIPLWGGGYDPDEHRAADHLRYPWRR